MGELDVHAAGGLLASASNDGTSRVWAIGGASTPPCVAAFACRVEGDTDPEAQVTAATWRPAAGAHAPPQLLSVSNTGHVFLHTAPPAADDAASAAAAPAVAPPPADQAAGWELAERVVQVPGARAPGATGKFDTFCTKWSAGGVRFAIGTSDCNVHVFRPRADGGAAPAWVATLRGHRHDVTSLSWAAAGDRILSGSVDGTARLWSLKGEMVGRALASSSDGPPPERWSSTQLGRPPEEGVAVPIVGQVAWTCDDKMVVAARTDATIGVWDGRSGRPLHTLAAYGTPGASALAHQDRIYVLDCHPTLPHVAVSASYDGTALLWDLGNGVATDALANIPLGDGECEFVDGRWSPGGDAIVLTDSSGRLHLHGLALGAASAADVNRDGTRVGGATALAAGGGGAAAAPYDQFFATDHEPLAPFDTAEAEAARPRAPICDQAISATYPQPVPPPPPPPRSPPPACRRAGVRGGGGARRGGGRQ